MSRFKNALIAFAGLVLLAGVIAALPLGVRHVQGSDARRPFACEPRRFYLTPTSHDGDETLTACAAGYHMASLWEIFDPTNLRYDTALGATLEDSGFGPPALPGWVRTGGNFGGTSLGEPNCKVWTSDSINDIGTVATLDFDPLDEATVVSPWRVFGGFKCSTPARVWCVQD